MDKSNQTRRNFIFVATGVTVAAGLGATLIPVFGHLNPGGDSLPHITVNLSTIKPGKNVKVLVNGQLIRIRHLTDKELDFVGGDKGRFQIYSAACPKEGCILVDLSHAHEYSYRDGREDVAWYCTCCGAYFDLMGRHVRGGGIKSDLDVPRYEYLSENIIEFRRLPGFAR